MLAKKIEKVLRQLHGLELVEADPESKKRIIAAMNELKGAALIESGRSIRPGRLTIEPSRLAAVTEA